jgi:RNA polymerase sigma-70 factor (ECF subfamily)
MLVDRCLDGEQAAARELFRQQRSRVQATLYRILGHNRDMDDLLQETFVQVFRSLANFRGEARLSTWIDRIAVRVAYRHLSRKKQMPLVSLELADVADGHSLPDRRVMARAGLRRFYAALSAQSPSGRIAFTLHVIEGRPVAQVAELMEASVTATKLRVWRTRRAILALAAADPVLREFMSDTEMEQRP